MKLFFFIHGLSSGGAERTVANLSGHFAAKGWDVSVATFDEPSSDFYELHPSVRRISIGLRGESKGLFRKVTRNLQRTRALKRTLLSERPDVAVSLLTTANVFLALAVMGDARMPPTVGSERNFPPRQNLPFIWKMLRKLTYRFLDVVTVQTQGISDWMANFVSTRNVVTIPNGIAPVSAEKPVVKAPERRLLLAVGSLEHKKGFDRLLSAFSPLAAKHPDWDLLILGEGAERERLERQVASLGLQERVSLPGRTTNVHGWYERADLFALSSRFEGFPNVLIEAMSHGLPAVGFDCDTGPRDIIRHGVDGLLVPQDDIAALTESLDSLMSDDTARENMGERAKDVLERFAMEKIAQLWEDVFVSLKKERNREAGL